jgi:hypothetical protein
MEFLDNLTIRAVEQTFNKGLPVDAGALLVTDVDGNLEEDLNFKEFTTLAHSVNHMIERANKTKKLARPNQNQRWLAPL